MPDWVCRPATSDDAEAIADLYAASGIPGAPALSGQVEVMLQTGHAFLVADDDPYLDAAVRFRDDEGRALAAAQAEGERARGVLRRGIHFLDLSCLHQRRRQGFRIRRMNV